MQRLIKFWIYTNIRWDLIYHNVCCNFRQQNFLCRPYFTCNIHCDSKLTMSLIFSSEICKKFSKNAVFIPFQTQNWSKLVVLFLSFSSLIKFVKSPQNLRELNVSNCASCCWFESENSKFSAGFNCFWIIFIAFHQLKKRNQWKKTMIKCGVVAVLALFFKWQN